MSETSIVLVNYNTPDDTIECISSLLNNSYSDFKIIVVDNHSTVENRNRIFQWLEGTHTAHFKAPEKLEPLVIGNEKFSGKYKLLQHSMTNGFEIPLNEIAFTDVKVILVFNNENAG